MRTRNKFDPIRSFLALTAACASIGTAVPCVAGQYHGFHAAHLCQDLQFVGDMLSCDLVAGYDDDFGDTFEVLEAYAVVDPEGFAVRVPASGHLPIVSVSGNTTGVVGGSVPVEIGPGGSTLHGLPGLPEPGVVTFRMNDYVIQPDDVDPLPVLAFIVWRDLCDVDSTDACSSLPATWSLSSATDIGHPDLSVTAEADPPALCVQSPETMVEFAFAVTNEGDVALENVIVVDDLCGEPAGPVGDLDGDGILDAAEAFTDENGSGNWEPGEPFSDDNGNGTWDDTETWSYFCSVLASEYESDLAEVSANVAGMPEAVVEGSAFVEVVRCPTDLDCDGATGFEDLLELFPVWGPCDTGSCPEDIDGNGVVGFGDVFSVLVAWGPCVP